MKGRRAKVSRSRGAGAGALRSDATGRSAARAVNSSSGSSRHQHSSSSAASTGRRTVKGAGEESGRSKTTAKPRSGSLKSRGASSPSAGDEVESGSDASDEDYKFATSTLTKSTRLLQLQGAVGGGMGARTKGQYILRIYKCIDLADETQTVLRASLCTIFADVLDGSEGEADELLRAFERVAHRVVENLDERRREWGGGVDEQGCSGASSRIGASSSAAGAKIAPERNRQGRRDATTNATASAEEEPEMRFGVKFFKAKALKAIQKALGGGTAVRTKVNFVLNIYKTASAASEGLRPALLAALRVAFYPLVKKHGSGTELDEELLRGFEFTALHFVPDLDPRFLLDNQPPVTRSAGKVRGWARSASAVRVAKKRRRSPAAGGGGNDSGSDDESDRSGERDGGKKAAEPTYEDFRPADRVRFVDAAVDARRGEGAVISIGYNLTFLHVRLDKTGKSVSVPRGEVTKCAESLAVLRRKKDNLRVLDANGTTLEVGMAVTCVGLYPTHVARGRSGVVQQLKGRGYVAVQLEDSAYWCKEGKITRPGNVVILPARNVCGLVAVRVDEGSLSAAKHAPRHRSDQAEAEAKRKARAVSKTMATAEGAASGESEAASPGALPPTHRLLSIGMRGGGRKAEKRALVLLRPKQPPVQKQRREETPTSHFIGVTSRFGGWQCRVTHAGTDVTLGQFDTEEGAAQAHDRYVLIHDLGRNLNFPAVDYGHLAAGRRSQSKRLVSPAERARARAPKRARTEPAAASAAAASSGRVYVTEGTRESLRSIAAKFALTPHTLLELNVAHLPRLKISSKLHCGTTILLEKEQATVAAADRGGGSDGALSMPINALNSGTMREEEDSGESEDEGGDDAGSVYTTEVTSETLVSISAKFGDNALRLLELNAWRLPGLTLTAKLRKGTSIDFIEAPASGDEEMSSDEEERRHQAEEIRQLAANRPKSPPSTSRGSSNYSKKSSVFTGVSKTGPTSWTARVTCDRVEKKLGTFDNEVDAAKAYDYFVLKMGLSRTLNFPSSKADVECDKDGKFNAALISSLHTRTLGQARQSSSKYTGVSRSKARMRGGWTARITNEGVERKLGVYNLELEAARAYDAYVLRHGLDGRFNFPGARAARDGKVVPQHVRVETKAHAPHATPRKGGTVYVTYERLRALDGGTSVVRAEYHEGVVIGVDAGGGVQVYFKGDGEYDSFGPNELHELLTKSAMQREQRSAAARGEVPKPLFAPLKKQASDRSGAHVSASASASVKAKAKVSQSPPTNANASAPDWAALKEPQPRVTREKREAEATRQRLARWGESTVADLTGLPVWSEWRDENALLRLAGITFALGGSGGDGDGAAGGAKKREALWRCQPLVRGERVVLSDAIENGMHRGVVGVITSIRGRGAIKVRLDKTREIVSTRVALVARLDTLLGESDGGNRGISGAARSKSAQCAKSSGAGPKKKKKKNKAPPFKPPLKPSRPRGCAACQGKHRAHTCERRGRQAWRTSTKPEPEYTSSFHGVAWDMTQRQWRSAGPRIVGEEITVHGYFDNEAQAAQARDAFVRRRQGAWRNSVALNFALDGDSAEIRQMRDDDEEVREEKRRADEAIENASLDAAWEAQIAGARPVGLTHQVAGAAPAPVVEARGAARAPAVVKDHARERAQSRAEEARAVETYLAAQQAQHVERARRAQIEAQAQAQAQQVHRERQARHAHKVLRNERAQHAPFRQHAIEIAQMRAHAQMEWAQQQYQAQVHAQMQAQAQAHEQKWAHQHYDAQRRAHALAQQATRAVNPNARAQAQALAAQHPNPPIERRHESEHSSEHPSEHSPAHSSEHSSEHSSKHSSEHSSEHSSKHSSKYRGVVWENSLRKWLACGPQGESQQVPLLGYFAGEEDAARARDYFVIERKLSDPLNFAIDSVAGPGPPSLVPAPAPAERVSGGRDPAPPRPIAGSNKKGEAAVPARKKRKAPSSQWSG